MSRRRKFRGPFALLTTDEAKKSHIGFVADDFTDATFPEELDNVVHYNEEGIKLLASTGV